MMSSRRKRWTLFGTLLLAFGPAAAQRPPEAPPSDAYGYVLVDHSHADCAFQFVDISGGGDAVSFVAASTSPADDDGGAVVALTEPFELYGVPLSRLVMSSNGYVAAADSLAAEDGGDFSNDALLPALPDNPGAPGAPGAPARIYAYHDELSGVASGGTAQTLYHASCPRASEALGDEPCTVLQWSGWSLLAGGDPFDVQALLYHRSRQLVLQLRPGIDPLDGGTVGVQNAAGDSAAQYFPAASLVGDTAVCIFDPRFPAGGAVADLVVGNENKVDTVSAGGTYTWAVTVLNEGPSPVEGATLSDQPAAGLASCSWTCSASEGSSCSASGTGAIDDGVDLAAGGWVDYRLTCQVTDDADAANHAAVTLPAGVSDPDPGDNSAVDDDSSGNEPPDCTLASVAPDALWPPNHNLVLVRVIGVRDPDGDPVAVRIESVFQDEPVRSTGSGNFVPDCELLEGGHLRLRSERVAYLTGRVYRIRYVAEDDHGGRCSGELQVAVPLDADGRASVVDEGPMFDSCATPEGRAMSAPRELHPRVRRRTGGS
jgi:uncharacterized repeat protein (TIGR01451 family)